LSPSFFIEAFPSHRALALAKTELPTGLWILIDSAWSQKKLGAICHKSRAGLVLTAAAPKRLEQYPPLPPHFQCKTASALREKSQTLTTPHRAKPDSYISDLSE